MCVFCMQVQCINALRMDIPGPAHICTHRRMCNIHMYIYIYMYSKEMEIRQLLQFFTRIFLFDFCFGF